MNSVYNLISYLGKDLTICDSSASGQFYYFSYHTCVNFIGTLSNSLELKYVSSFLKMLQNIIIKYFKPDNACLFLGPLMNLIG